MTTDDKTLSRIASLLRQAEGTSNEHEADAYMQAAQRLASTHAIDLAVARAHTARAERRSAPTHRTITLGPPRKRGLRTYVQLFLVIAAANDVTCNIAHNSTYVVAFGFEEDIAVTEALYASLVIQMVRACDAYLNTGAYLDDLAWRRVTRTDRYGYRYRTEAFAPVSKTMARINFHQGFASRIGQRLRAAAEQAKREAIAADRALMERTSIEQSTPAPDLDSKSGTELAIIGKAVEIADYYTEHSDAKGTWKGARARTDAAPGARSAGDQAGRTARLGTEKEIGGARKALRPTADGR